MSKRNPAAVGLMIFSAFMAIVYIVLGAILLMNGAPGLLPPPYAQIMGALVVLYGLFRFYREWVKYKSAGQNRGPNQL